MAALSALPGCANRPVVPAAQDPAASRPAGCPRSPVALKVLGDDDELRLWYLDELTKRSVAVDPGARTTLRIEMPVVEDRRGEACLVLAAKVTCDGQDFSAHVIEATRCYPGPADNNARFFRSVAGVAAGVATGRSPEFPPGPEVAPVVRMRTELVERIARASR
jgi:hypothetical protein